jgi:hypothetical protein
MYLHQILHVVFFGAVTLHCRASLMLVSCEILYNYEESPQLKWLNESRIIPAIHGLSHAEVKPSKRRELQDFRFFPVFFSRIAGMSPQRIWRYKKWCFRFFPHVEEYELEESNSLNFQESAWQSN